MKLCYSALSPFARKVRVTAIEHGLMDQLEKVDPDTSDMFKGFNRANPLGKIPSLELDNGDLIYDSIVICEYLDSIGKGPKLFPPAGPERWRVLTLHTMANGMMDNTLQRRVNSLLPEGEGSPSWMERLRFGIENCLDEMERHADGYGEALNIGTITVACALGYHDFRLGHEQWRNGRPALTRWYEKMLKRPSISETLPG